MPAILETPDGETVEVVTTGDVWRFLRWCGIPVITVAVALIVRDVTLHQSVVTNANRLMSDSAAIRNLWETKADRSDVQALHINIDSSLGIQREILRAVTHR